MMKVDDLTLTRILDGYKRRDFSVEEVVKGYLGRIEKLDKKVGAFLTVTKEEALGLARETDKRIESLGEEAFFERPLLGVPVAFKDLYLTKGVRTMAGSKVLEKYVPVYSATVVEKVEAAGGIILGKLNCDAWAHGVSGENSDFFPSKNPWDLRLVPGGSSSGSAVAVAAGFVPVAFGTDTGGSIRCPAAFCGVTGLKPTYGRVSRYGVVAMASSLDSMGHLALDVCDVARVLRVSAGEDMRDATSARVLVSDYGEEMEKDAKGLKIGLPKEYFGEGIDREVKEAVLEAAKRMESLGAKVEEVTIPYSKYVVSVYYIIQTAEVSSNLARYDGIRYGEERSRFGDEAKRRIMIGTHVLSSGYYDAYYKKAVKVQERIKSDFESVFRKVDMLLGPVMPNLPFRLGEKTEDPLQMYLADIYTAGVNLAGLPALALP